MIDFRFQNTSNTPSPPPNFIFLCTIFSLGGQRWTLTMQALSLLGNFPAMLFWPLHTLKLAWKICFIYWTIIVVLIWYKGNNKILNYSFFNLKLLKNVATIAKCWTYLANSKDYITLIHFRSFSTSNCTEQSTLEREKLICLLYILYKYFIYKQIHLNFWGLFPKFGHNPHTPLPFLKGVSFS